MVKERLRHEIFKLHMHQFKYRSIAWHIVYKPVVPEHAAKRGPQMLAFECLFYHWACGGDVLARIRIQYVKPLQRAKSYCLEPTHQAGQETGDT
jgi:hypothetical protein